MTTAPTIDVAFSCCCYSLAAPALRVTATASLPRLWVPTVAGLPGLQVAACAALSQLRITADFFVPLLPSVVFQL
ncbi:hypothetical protein Acr_25g0000840 [Actinidia rufa]|uniref:Uncharacterized protein n=1 Tax=Actinidia rufa TaxID=165716 RepID=A0A7J0GXX1_9ERIC|nr:hypothetical protein Acr_25g0000840 [Actinidia rufa]